ncbi:hypothetical protein [Chelativorans sp. M5D2P16]|uniref:hypothetical protein n=1 Tax=Chelativorans sp. M5D2P16 TaxID=3095678 RepID=UPI002ACB0551|nr:hypothetical protein [Chelativorans sp. M5D2P16]MDZ5696762.1 hypothetical protein [Chelativorans sp. M5D2P16]
MGVPGSSIPVSLPQELQRDGHERDPTDRDGYDHHVRGIGGYERLPEIGKQETDRNDADSFLAGIDQVDYGLLKTIKSMVGHLEVGRCSLADWEAAILKGFEIWRQMVAHGGGLVRIDLEKSSIFYEPPADVTGQYRSGTSLTWQ